VAAVRDLFSGRVLGWSTSGTMIRQLVIDALEIELVHHQHFAPRREAHAHLFEWIEAFADRRRRRGPAAFRVLPPCFRCMGTAQQSLCRVLDKVWICLGDSVVAQDRIELSTP
jgi:hypothetical protein